MMLCLGSFLAADVRRGCGAIVFVGIMLIETVQGLGPVTFLPFLTPLGQHPHALQPGPGPGLYTTSHIRFHMQIHYGEDVTDQLKVH